jgi:hypothetical protein
MSGPFFGKNSEACFNLPAFVRRLYLLVMLPAPEMLLLIFVGFPV